MLDAPHTDPLVVNLERFQGPLDLLLHLIRKQDIDIFDIPISRITQQFLQVIEDMGRLELERAGEFVEMAATLVRIKAQMLFPRRHDEEEDDPRVELVRRLLEYEHFRDAAIAMERAERNRARHFRKGYLPPRSAPSKTEVPLETGWDDVWSAVLELVARSTESEPGYRLSGRQIRIEDKIEYILYRLAATRRVEFSSLVNPWGTRVHAVMSLLASLELAKRSAVHLRQTTPFAALWLHRRDEPTDAA